MRSFKCPKDLTVTTVEKNPCHVLNGKQIVLIILTENWGFDALREYMWLHIFISNSIMTLKQS